MEPFSLRLYFKSLGFELTMNPIYVAVYGAKNGPYFLSAYSQALAITCTKPFKEPPSMALTEGLLAACPYLLGTFLAEDQKLVFYWRRENISDIYGINDIEIPSPDQEHILQAEAAHWKVVDHFAKAGHAAKPTEIRYRNDSGDIFATWTNAVGDA